MSKRIEISVDEETVMIVARAIDPMPFSEREPTPHDEKRRTMAHIRALDVIAALSKGSDA